LARGGGDRGGAESPDSAFARLSLARAYAASGELAQAQIELDALLLKSPDNIDALILRAGVLQANKNLDGAKTILTGITEKQPRSPVGWQALAEFQARAGDMKTALETLGKGIAAAQPVNELRMARAGFLEVSGDVDGAITEYETLLKDEPGSLVVVNNLASLLSDFKTDQASRDRAAALAATLRDSPIPQFRDTLGWTLVQKGQYREAVTILERSATELATVPLAQYHLARAYAGAGDKTRAIDVLKKATTLKGIDKDMDKISAALKELGG
jgi:cellulose synthase operon protein C